MPLKIYPAQSLYDDLYDSLLEGIPAGTQFIKAPVVLPYLENQTSSFIIEGNIGDVVEIYINQELQNRFTLTLNKVEVGLQLVYGRNFIVVKTRFESYLILVAATNYATYIKAWSQQFYNNVVVDVDDTERQLNSKFSLRAVEHQINFQNLLPPTRVFRTLAGKLAIRSLINETGSTRGVNDIATAASNTTPFVVPTQVSTTKFEPIVYTLYDKAHDFGGFEFNIWLPNITAATWAAFIKLINNLDDSTAKLLSVSDSKVTLEYLGTVESHVFDFEDPNADIVSIITDLLDCFYPIRVSIEQITETEVAFCAWVPTGDLIIDNPLGSEVLDFGNTLDSGLFLDNEVDPADPLTDGWLGTSLSQPLDSGTSLDAVPSVTLLEDLECLFDPNITLLGSSLLDVEIAMPQIVTASLIIDNADYGWILNEGQLNVNSILG